MNRAEASGRTVEEAVERALAELGASREDVDVEVVDAGARGMLGLGAREARVRVTLRESLGAVAHHLAARLLHEMGFAGTVRVHETDGSVTVDIGGSNLGALIGRRGATLDALQFLLGLMVSRRSGVRVRVVLDVGGYRERRGQTLAELARRAADRSVRERGEVELEPMDAADRRAVHTALAEHPHVRTFSRGEGAARHVVVAPKEAGLPSTVDASPRDVARRADEGGDGGD